jgi:tagatose-6-phosphate ketose/aldose isomerase
LAYILETEPEIRHLVFTCNQNGSLARAYRSDPRVTVVTLDDVTNDRSLVMTSSFTNLVLAARSLGLIGRPEHYESICTQLSQIGSRFLNDHFGAVAEAATAPFQRAVFLASGSRFGGTREASLKMLEMTSGRVTTMCETYLSFRHGPMAYVNDETLVVCCLSSDSMLRAYESDLIRELDEKKLGLAKILIGENVPKELARDGDTVLECPGLRALGDENFPVIDVLAGQLLAFFRCRQEGLRPDSPSEDGVISRVVRSFTLHSPKS